MLSRPKEVDRSKSGIVFDMSTFIITYGIMSQLAVFQIQKRSKFGFVYLKVQDFH